MSNHSTSMFNESAGGNVNLEGNELINSGQNTIVNKSYYHFNIGVFKVPDVIGYIAKPFVALIRMNQESTGADDRERDPVEITNLMTGDPSPLPVSSIADRYTRSMLECMVGYPLYEPEPFSELSTEYSGRGVNVGDVGFVREDGAFDFLFNICSTQNGSINPHDLPDGFCLPERPEHSKTRTIRPLERETCFVSSTVTKMESGKYTCRGSEGAVLVLPKGAIQDEAISTGRFRDLAKLRGVEWYEYTKFRGRSISNGSLYLITSFTKCAQWGIAVLDRPCESGQALKFVNSPLGWKGLGALITKVANSTEGDTPNQCVFLRGYKIMIRQDIFDKLPTRQPAQRIRGGGGTDRWSKFGNALTWAKTSTAKKSDKAVLRANVNSSPVHPSDLINAELLSQNPDAKVALTHDDVWCDLLRDNFPKLHYRILEKVARSYTSMVDEYGCVSLEKISGSSNVPHERNHPLRGPKAPALQKPIQDARKERNPGVLIEDNHSHPIPIRTPSASIANLSFDETDSPVAAIQAVLYDYPFSASILRELLQNSDDAGATKQIFVLDKDNPALIGYNDSEFLELDWQAIQRTHTSSKADTSKIGKYGVGFKACYHITDQPQILSGPFFGILDPLNSKGMKIEYDYFKTTEYCKHFNFFSNISKRNSFPGTAIRLPLRSSRSDLSQRIVRIDELQRMISDYISEELNVSLLFLDKLKTIEVWETGNGIRTCLAKWTKSGRSSPRHDHSLQLVTYDSVLSDGDTKYPWRIVRTQSTENEAIAHLSQLAGNDLANYIVQRHQSRPDVRIAYPLTSREQMSGCLFTFLPLPSKTGFPVHIHALFAMTSSRQRLRKSNEKGIVKGSDNDVLIKWNQLLFNHYIPQVWSYLLKTLAEDGCCSDILDAWPPHRSSITSGDGVYWQDILTNTFKVVVESGLKVWPTVTAQGTTTYIDLKSSLIAARGQVDAGVLAVLAELGLMLVQLPQCLLDLVDDSMTRLSPSVAHGRLQGASAFDRFSKLSADQRALICEYLLSDNDISNIFGHPLIPVSNGSLVALTVRKKSVQHFLALAKDEERVFRISSPYVILLDQLSPGVARLILEQAVSHANVDILSPQAVVEFLSSGRRFLSDEWLIEFWCWLDEWDLKTDLFNLLKENSILQLIPTTMGPQSITFPIFNATRDMGNVQLFEKLGLAFVSFALPASVIHFLLNHNILRNANDLNQLLTAINLDSVASLTDDEAQSILRLATSYYGSISADNLEKLRKLPIFPLLVPIRTPLLPPNSNSSVFWRSIHGINVKGISPIQLIPFAGDMCFLSGSSIEYSSCPLLKQLNIPVLKEDDILLHTLRDFTSQSKPLQATFVSYIRNNPYRLPIVTLTLRRTAFLRTTDGSLQSPEKVIDPNSPLASLFTKGCKDSRVPMNEDGFDQQLFGDLQTLGLTKTKLDAYLVQDRIAYISSTSSAAATTIARSLFKLMNEPSFSCLGLFIDPHMCWLPTASGLATSKKCINSGRRDTDLFDQVLVALDGSISISPSFKALLDWDKPLPLEVLTEQLRHTLDLPALKVQSQKIRSIIRELAGRQLRDTDIQDIQSMISGRSWVPTKSGRLAQPSRAVFVNVDIASGFHEVAFSKTEKEIYLFLCRMGCLEKPTAAAITKELEKLQEQSKADGNVVQRAILLLHMLPDSMTEGEHQSILVPDQSGSLVPLSDGICYNGGLRSGRSGVNEGEMPVAHRLVTEGLAEKLGMNRLGLQVEDDIDQEGKFTTIIRNTLDQYDHTQFFTEFVANASDAKAKHFSLLIDDHKGPTDKLISKGMKAFQNASLVVYNDGVFTQDDFKGITKMGIGGKRGKPDVIGYFGLGALSMFHFTELAMIVSGSHVMFLNPSKQNLSYQGRDSVLFSLQGVKRQIPDHLEPLNDLFGFDLNSTEHFQGTIFRLPLRNSTHLTNESVSSRFWSVKEIETMLLKQFDDLAYKSLLFTGLNRIDILARRGFQSKTLRSIEVARVPVNHAPEKPFKSEIATFKVNNIQMKWFILSQLVQMPDEFENLLEKRHNNRHIPPIQVAAAIDGAQGFGADRNLFCGLPFSSATSFPVHISAPFVLEKGRRNVHLDNMGPESEFNRWLLSSEIPRLYLYLLDTYLKTQGTNAAYWPPTRLGRDNADSMASQIIIDAFWTPKVLGSSSRRIFVSRKKPTTRLAPKDAVVLVRKQNFFDTISRIMDVSNVGNVVELPSELCEDVNYAGLRIVDPLFVKTLLEDPHVCRQLDRDEKYMALLFLCVHKMSLYKLPLLPLEDGSFSTILLQGDPDKLYYAIEQAPGVSYPPFRKSRLICRDLESFLSKNGQVAAWASFLCNYNVSLLSAEGVVELIEDYIKPADELVGDQDHRVWVDSFWNAQLKLPQAVSFFPLVSTQKPHHYISLQKVNDPSVIVLEEPPEQRSHFSVLQSLGLVVVVRQALPSTLRDVLPTKRTGVYATFLDFVKNNPETLGMLRGLHADEQEVLGSWIRANFSYTPESFANIACQLPVWPVQQVAKDPRLAPLNDDDVVLLPPSMHTNLLRPFTDHPLVNWEDCMKSAKKEPCTAKRILELLDVSVDFVLRFPERATYKEFVRIFMTIDEISDQQLLLPNSDFVLRRASDLYEHNEPFIATFKVDSPVLLSQDFQDLAQDLERYGLKRQRQLDLSMFIECAKAFDSERDRAKRARAVVLYQSFNSLRLSSLDCQRSSELDLLKFIPRVDSQRPDYNNINTIDYMADLPRDLLAPSQITIPEFEAICWSQKGKTNPPPNATLCSTYQTLGRPDGADVLAHLAVLAEMAQKHGRRRGLLLDLRATYKWLNDHASDIASVISEKKRENLFLNVDDPKSDDWIWHSASNLVIGLQDIYNLRYVKGFLRNYNELLDVAGVRKIKKRTATIMSTTDNKMRDRYNDMRQSGFDTDVVFKAQDNRYQILPAHKSWLVASNNHFRATFITSGMKESRALKTDEPIRVEHSSMCVREVIDWFYVGKLSDLLINNNINEEETKRRLELALEMLSLADEWEVTDLHKQLQVFIINDQDLFNPYWIRRIRQHAEVTMATQLLKYCQKYEEENRSIIDDCTHGNLEDEFSPVEERDTLSN